MINAATNKRYSGIEGLRAFSAIFVVLFHVLDKFGFEYIVPCGKEVELFLSSFVSLFMMISAFSLCCGYYEKIKNNEISLNDFYKKRYIRILPLFLIMVILDIVFSGITKNNLFEGFANITLLFGFLPHSNISIVGVGWTIGVIFAFYILFPFFVFAFWNKKRAWIFLLLSLLLRYISINYFFEENIEVIHSFIVWIPYFSLGMIIYLYKTEIEKHLFKFRYFIWVITISLLFLKYENLLVCGINLGDLYRLLSDSSLLITAIVSSNLLLSNKVFGFISKVSYEIYMIHIIFVNLFVLLFKNVNDIYLKIIIVFSLSIILTILSAFVYHNIEKLILKKSKGDL